MEQEKEPKKEKIKNKHYKEFLQKNLIKILTKSEIGQALNNVTGEHKREGRCLLIAAYYTGARPNEYLKLRAKNITKDGHYIAIELVGSKNGLPRVVWVSLSRPYIKELYDYAISLFPNLYLFWNFRNSYKRRRITKKGEVREYEEISDKLRYYFKKWFKHIFEDPVPPYYLRHNRFSSMIMSGASTEDIRLMKGAKTQDSVFPYVHMSKKSGKNMSRFNK